MRARFLSALAILALLAAAPALAAPNSPVNAQVSCATTPTAVFAVDQTKVARLVSNQSGVTVFFGKSDVSTSTGFPVPTGSGSDFSRSEGALFCVVATSTATIGTIQY